MINYYKKSLKEFKKYIKQKPNCTKQDWDEYAHNNCLFSAFTLECHKINDNTLKMLIKENKNRFEFLKELFIIKVSQKKNRRLK